MTLQGPMHVTGLGVTHADLLRKKLRVLLVTPKSGQEGAWRGMHCLDLPLPAPLPKRMIVTDLLLGHSHVDDRLRSGDVVDRCDAAVRDS